MSTGAPLREIKRGSREDMKDIVRREKLKLRIQDTREIQMLTAVGRTDV